MLNAFLSACGEAVPEVGGYIEDIEDAAELETEALDEFHSLGSVSGSAMEDILEKYSLVN